MSIIILISTSFVQAQTPAPPAASASKLDLNFNFPNFAGFLEPFIYETRGRRDPFAQVLPERQMSRNQANGPDLPLQQYELKDLRLTGIIWDVSRPRALFKDPKGRVHIVGPNAKLGKRNGYIAVIREGELVVVETVEEDGRLLSSTKIVKLESNTSIGN
jgi:type IV pilus assembly protein PilP